jgi:hypothetical protein
VNFSSESVGSYDDLNHELNIIIYKFNENVARIINIIRIILIQLNVIIMTMYCDNVIDLSIFTTV